jgi:hypothetical protein
MAGRRAAWLMVAGVVAGVSVAACTETPTQPGAGGFSWTVTPDLAPLTLQQGATGTFTIRINSKVNINSGVSFGLLGSLPPNSTWTFAPQQLASTAQDATLTVQTTSQTPVAAYPLIIEATEIGYLAFQKSIRLDVVGPSGVPDFLLELDPADMTLGSSPPTVSFRVIPINGFAGTVDIFIDGVDVPPAPVVIASGPNPPRLTFASGDPARGGTFVAALAQRPSYPPTWSLVVRAVSGPLVHTRTLNITINR